MVMNDLITPENIKTGIKAGFTFLKNKTRKIPMAVNYDLTWECNLNCKHCYFNASKSELGKYSSRSIQNLTDQQWLKVFNHHRDLGIVSAALTGGEPTLRMNLIEHALKIFPTIQVASNGLIKLPNFKGLKQPVYWVSLDGGEEMHNSIRGAKIFQRIIKNIEDDKRVFISHTISSMNYKEIEKVVKIAYDIGVSGIFFLFYTGVSGDPLLLSGEMLKSVTKSILKILSEYGDFIIFSRKMLELYITKEFVPNCIFKMGGVKSYYPNGQRKFCVMGNSEKLCENCGCIVPIAEYAASKFDLETLRKINRFSF